MFAANLLSLIRHDQAVPAGDTGRLDHNPICAGQDFAGFVPKSMTITSQTADTASAIVSFNNDATQTQVSFKLKKIEQNWRIDDIANPGMPSLQNFSRLINQP